MTPEPKPKRRYARSRVRDRAILRESAMDITVRDYLNAITGKQDAAEVDTFAPWAARRRAEWSRA